VALHLSTVNDARDDARRAHVEHDELDQPVIDEDAIAHVDVACEPFVRDRHLVAARCLFRAEDDIHAGLELSGGIEIANADARALQIAEDRDGATTLLAELANDRNGARVLLVRPV
jgi:hypothetical protein